MDTDNLNPESAAVMNEAPIWEPDPPKQGEDPPIETGAVSCRFLEKRKGTVTRWESHWALFAPLKAEGGTTARVDFHGRTMDMTTELTVTPTGRMLFYCEEMGVRIVLGRLDDTKGNALCISRDLGILDAITVSECLKDLGRSSSFGKEKGPDVQL